MSSVSSTEDIQETRDFRELARKTEEDVDALMTDSPIFSLGILDEKIDYDDRVRRLGEAVSCLLVSRKHCGGYPIDNNGFKKLRDDFHDTFGLDLEEFTTRLGFKTMSNFMLSSIMEPYVQTTTNNNKLQVFVGRVIENEDSDKSNLLGELLREQETGQRATESKELANLRDRRIRIDVAKIKRTAVEGRLRIYRIIGRLGGNNEFVPYQSVQAEYAKEFETMLNKDEIKKFFGIGEALKALKEYTSNDLIIEQDENSAIYVKLKRELSTIEEGYMELLKEANELPAREQIAEEEEARKMRFERETGRRNKGKRVSAPPAFEVDEDVLRNRSALFENSFTMPSALNSQNVQPSNVQTPSFFSVQNTEPIRVEAPYSKREDTPELPEDPQYTTLGDGKYSDSDPSSEEEEENINVPPLKRMEPKSDVPSAIINTKSNAGDIKPDSTSTTKDVHPRNTTITPGASVFSNYGMSGGPTPSINGGVSGGGMNGPVSSVSGVKKTSQPLTSTDQSLDETRKMVIKAFVYGFLKSTSNMYIPVDNTIKKAMNYLTSRGLKTSKTDVETFIRSLEGEFKFFYNGKYFALADINTKPR